MSRVDASEPSIPARRTTGRQLARWHVQLLAMIALVGALLWFGADRGGLEIESTPTLEYVSISPRRAPSFEVPRIGGGAVTLSERTAHGRPIVLNLWASWCIPCRQEMPALEMISHDYQDVVFIGIAVQDTVVASESFAANIGVTFDLGIDDGTVMDAYPTVGLPTTWFIDRDGMIVGQRFGEMTADELTSHVVGLLSR